MFWFGIDLMESKSYSRTGKASKNYYKRGFEPTKSSSLWEQFLDIKQNKYVIDYQHDFELFSSIVEGLLEVAL